MAASTPRKKKNVKQLLAGAQRAFRTVDICTRADLVDEYETIEARLEKAKADSNSIGGHPDIPVLTERLEQLREEMRDATLTFKIRGLPQRQYTELLAQHPPRKDDKRDALLGMNIDAVVEQLIRQGTVEPELDDDDWEQLLGDVINVATYEQLTNAAWSVNNKDVSAPFSPAE